MKILLSLLAGVFCTSVVFVTVIMPSTTPAPVVITEKSDNVVLLGNAKSSEVLSGKTFYNNSYTKQVGTLTLEGDAVAEDVLLGKKFYNNTFSLQTGLYVPEEIVLTGNVTQSDVLAGKTFYSNSTIKRTGTLAFSGDTDPGDVLAGKTFYSDSTTKQTGTLALTGDADVGDVMSGKTFYSDSLTEKTGTWSFLGDATVNDVVLGKTFYSDSSTLLTGTATAGVDYSYQSLVTEDDYSGTYQGEEATWTEIPGSPFADFVGAGYDLRSGIVKEDSITGLAWTATSTNRLSNSFTFNGDGVRPTGGNAIGLCDALNNANYGGRSNWYLPTEKELLQALIDGIYSQDPSFVEDGGMYWSSTKKSGSATDAWGLMIQIGYTDYTQKTGTYAVKCVSREVVI